MATKINCCYQCDKRHINCHADCADYIEQRQQRVEDLRHIKRVKHVDNAVVGVLMKNKR